MSSKSKIVMALTASLLGSIVNAAEADKGCWANAVEIANIPWTCEMLRVVANSINTENPPITFDVSVADAIVAGTPVLPPFVGDLLPDLAILDGMILPAVATTTVPARTGVLRTDVTALDAALLAAPTGNLGTDVTTVDHLIIAGGTGPLSTDIGTVKAALGGGTTSLLGDVNYIINDPLNGTALTPTLGDATVNQTIEGALINVVNAIGGTTQPYDVLSGIGQVKTKLGVGGVTSLLADVNYILNDAGFGTALLPTLGDTVATTVEGALVNIVGSIGGTIHPNDVAFDIADVKAALGGGSTSLLGDVNYIINDPLNGTALLPTLGDATVNQTIEGALINVVNAIGGTTQPYDVLSDIGQVKTKLGVGGVTSLLADAGYIVNDPLNGTALLPTLGDATVNQTIEGALVNVVNAIGGTTQPYDVLSDIADVKAKLGVVGGTSLLADASTIDASLVIVPTNITADILAVKTRLGINGANLQQDAIDLGEKILIAPTADLNADISLLLAQINASAPWPGSGYTTFQAALKALNGATVTFGVADF